MRPLPPSLAAKYAAGTTTLCWCWRLARRDGTRMGFTDHDRDVAFDGTTFEAAAGFIATELMESAGLAVDNLEVEGALSSGRLTEADLAAGLWDGARVEIWRVDWTNPDDRILLKTATLGEVRRSGRSFAAEVRGLTHELQRPTGRLFQYTCDADLGDARCRIDVTSATYRTEARFATRVGPSVIEVDGAGSLEAGWLNRGLLAVMSGAAAGFRVEIREHTASVDRVRLALWQPVPESLAAGDVLVLTAGCDKQPVTCAAKFANIRNFRGFPHMPGNDYVTAIARPGATIRGTSAS